MQLCDLQQLVSKLKENKDMQVETTTLGKFLGTSSTQVAMTLGKEILNRPIIVTTTEDQIQILDLSTGFVISLKSVEEVLPKLVSAFNKETRVMPSKVTSVEQTKNVYKEVMQKEIHTSSISAQLCEFKENIHQPGSVEDRLGLVEKTIKVLEDHKVTCEDGEREKVVKAQDKLNKLITHARSNSLAPGQVPCVYELAVWSWVN